jgi:hypothetical protein
MTVIADAYQAAIAVSSPRYPPSTVRPACELKAPIASPNAPSVHSRENGGGQGESSKAEWRRTVREWYPKLTLESHVGVEL